MSHRWVAALGLLVGIVLTSSSLTDTLPFTRTATRSHARMAAWPCRLPGDIDCDCEVNIADIMLVATLWHTTEGDADYVPLYDVDASGDIDIVDIMLVAVHWGETCEVATFQVSASSDDALDTYDVGNDAYSHTINAMVVGHAGTSGTFQGPVHTGFRFANVTVPSGSVIVTATLRVKNRADLSDTVFLKLAAHDAYDSPAFADTASGRPSGRTIASPQVDWDINSTWQADAWYESPDLADIIQKVVEQPGWEAGHGLSIIIRDDGSDSGNRRRVYAYDNDPADAALLIVCYLSPSSTPTGTPTPSSSPTATPTPGTPTSTPTSTPTPIPDTPTPTPTSTTSTIWQPSGITPWQLQFADLPIDQSYNVVMYDIDLFDNDASIVTSLQAQSHVVIAYFSAGSWEDWRPDADDFPESVKGASNGWPGEKWLDIRQLDILGPIMEARMDLAVQKGFDGVDPDNVDGYDNDTGFSISYADQLAYNIFLANAAHQRGLSICLKNDLGQVADLEPYFDWALNEECHGYNECDELLPFIDAGKAVMHIEYDVSTSAFCPWSNTHSFSSMKKRLDLDAWMDPCW